MLPLSVFSQEYGLSFKGQDFLLDERTSLDITSNKPLIVKDEFELIFDLKVKLLKRKGKRVVLNHYMVKKPNVLLILYLKKTNLLHLK